MEEFFGATETWYDYRIHPLYLSIVWIFLVYALDPVICNSGNITKCQTGSCQVNFFGLSLKHESTVINILSLNISLIITQFQIIYEKWFQTMSISEYTILKFWFKLVESKRGNFLIYLYDDLQLDQYEKFKYPELAY